VGSGRNGDLIYAALPLEAKRLFTKWEPMAFSSQGSNLTIAPRLALNYMLSKSKKTLILETVKDWA